MASMIQTISRPLGLSSESGLHQRFLHGRSQALGAAVDQEVGQLLHARHDQRTKSFRRIRRFERREIEVMHFLETETGTRALQFPAQQGYLLISVVGSQMHPLQYQL